MAHLSQIYMKKLPYSTRFFADQCTPINNSSTLPPFEYKITVLRRINAGGVHLIFHIFRGAFIQGRRLYEGGVYYKIQKKLQFYISTSIRKTALSSSTSGICDQIERVRTTRFVYSKGAFIK